MFKKTQREHRMQTEKKNRICNSIVFDYLDVTHIYGYSKYPIYSIWSVETVKLKKCGLTDASLRFFFALYKLMNKLIGGIPLFPIISQV